MDLDAPLRVNYYEGQYLRAQDFTDEQRYQLATQRRHALTHHTWGIAFGLQVLELEGILVVEAGVAVDGFGRDLVLDEPVAIDPRLFEQRASDVLDVWLLYGRTGSASAAPAGTSCDTTAAQFDRWHERPTVRVTVPDPAYTNRRQPAGLTDAELAFNATRPAPDDPEHDWPVFLGQVRRNLPGVDARYAIDPSDRPYIGLVGDAVRAPSGLAWLALGHDPRSDRELAFAVHVQAAPDSIRALAIDRGGNLELVGRATVHGSVHVEGSALEIKSGVTDPEVARPWSIYRADIAERAIERRRAGSGVALPGKELRIEVEEGGQVVFGTWSTDDGAFRPCLTVTKTGVRVHGDLIVDGTIPQRVGSQRLDAAARVATTSSLVGGAIASGTEPRDGPRTAAVHLLTSSGTSVVGSLPDIASVDAAIGDRMAEFVAHVRGDPARFRQLQLAVEGDG